MANTYLTRTPSSTGNRKILTISCWFKRSNVSSTQTLFANGGNSYNRDYISLESNQLVVARYDGGYQYQIKLTRLFRDTSAWYHLVVAFNTTESSSDNRIKIYINGVRETSFATNTRPSLNRDTWYNYSGKLQNIGVDYDNAGNDFNGLMSHVHWCDGAALAPTVFGETDSTTGEWKIKTSPSFTPGTNGFTILKDGNTITDQSANSNNFSLGGGTITVTKDCPDNVFCTMNPLVKQTDSTLTQGNNSVTYGTASTRRPVFGTLAATSGKFYYEVKCLATSTTVCETSFGIANTYNPEAIGNALAANGYTASFRSPSPTSIYIGATSTITGLGDMGINDIFGVLMNLDNNQISIRKNGDTSWSAASFSSQNSGEIGGWTPAINCTSGSATFTLGFNFGNGTFGTTAITTNSGNGYAGAEGASKFNYAVPSGYSALSTKGLNQ